MPSFRAIFFDIGDTLVFDDPPIRERFRLATRCAGIDYPPECLPAAFRAGEAYAIARYLQGEPSDAPHVLQGTAFHILTALGVPSWTDEQWQALREAFLGVPWRRVLHTQALPLVGALRERGFRVGAISDWEDTLPGLLDEMGLGPYLEALAVSATVGCTKPDPRLFQEALRQVGVAPEQSLHVGDWYELDVLGARAAGMTGVLFDLGQRRPEADCPRMENFDELAAFLLSLPCPAP